MCRLTSKDLDGRLASIEGHIKGIRKMVQDGTYCVVRSVKVDIPARAVTVDYDEATVSVDRFKELLKEEEYPVAEVS